MINHEILLTSPYNDMVANIHDMNIFSKYGFESESFILE